jgi:hypothetical protein
MQNKLKVSQGISRQSKVNQGQIFFWEALIFCMAAVPRLAPAPSNCPVIPPRGTEP